MTRRKGCNRSIIYDLGNNAISGTPVNNSIIDTSNGGTILGTPDNNDVLGTSNNNAILFRSRIMKLQKCIGKHPVQESTHNIDTMHDLSPVGD